MVNLVLPLLGRHVQSGWELRYDCFIACPGGADLVPTAPGLSTSRSECLSSLKQNALLITENKLEDSIHGTEAEELSDSPTGTT